MLEQILNGDFGLSIRTKLNKLIAFFNGHLKTSVFSFMMLPADSNSSYYLESNSFPAQVFVKPTDTTCKIILSGYGNDVPSGATGFKLSLSAITTDTSQGGFYFSFNAGWTSNGASGYQAGTAVTFSFSLNGKTLTVTPFSNKITPAGERAEQSFLSIFITRLATNANDEFNGNLRLVKVDIEWTFD